MAGCCKADNKSPDSLKRGENISLAEDLLGTTERLYRMELFSKCTGVILWHSHLRTYNIQCRVNLITKLGEIGKQTVLHQSKVCPFYPDPEQCRFIV